MNSDFDLDILKKELEELETENIDLSLTGFDFNEIDDLFEIEDVEKKESESFEDEIKKYNDENCKFPIVPDFFENHECFIIPVHNKIDEAFIRDFFDLNENHESSSNDKKIRKTNVINIDKVRECIVK